MEPRSSCFTRDHSNHQSMAPRATPTYYVCLVFYGFFDLSQQILLSCRVLASEGNWSWLDSRQELAFYIVSTSSYLFVAGSNLGAAQSKRAYLGAHQWVVYHEESCVLNTRSLQLIKKLQYPCQESFILSLHYLVRGTTQGCQIKPKQIHQYHQVSVEIPQKAPELKIVKIFSIFFFFQDFKTIFKNLFRRKKSFSFSLSHSFE